MNAIGAYFTHGPMAGVFRFETYAKLPKRRGKKPPKEPGAQAARHGVRPEAVGTINSERLVAFLWKIAGRPEAAPVCWRRERVLVIVLDNYSVHQSARVKAEIPLLLAAGIVLWYLPAYSPEMSKIEPIWLQVKYHEMPKRSYTLLGELHDQVDASLTKKAMTLRGAQHETAQSLRLAA